MTAHKELDHEPTKEFPMHFLHIRLESYTDWPFDDSCSCTPEKMAQTGFYHCPTEREPDLVKCFVCLKELDGWEPEDDPWLEHKRHSAQCPFLQYCNPEAPKKMTVENFLKLEHERQIILGKKEFNCLEQELKKYANDARTEMESLI